MDRINWYGDWAVESFMREVVPTLQHRAKRFWRNGKPFDVDDLRAAVWRFIARHDRSVNTRKVNALMFALKVTQHVDTSESINA
jgi:hypothetical protein